MKCFGLPFSVNIALSGDASPADRCERETASKNETMFMTCNHCQEQLLHYLYDVLDPDERAAVAQHLDECAACRAARDALVAQQELLAEAAKESFAEVTFQPPTGTPKRFGEPTQILPRRQRGFSWVRVAVAACIAIFVLGGGAMGVMGWFRTKDEILAFGQ